jgi:hypothetical protein
MGVLPFLLTRANLLGLMLISAKTVCNNILVGRAGKAPSDIQSVLHSRRDARVALIGIDPDEDYSIVDKVLPIATSEGWDFETRLAGEVNELLDQDEPPTSHQRRNRMMDPELYRRLCATERYIGMRLVKSVMQGKRVVAVVPRVLLYRDSISRFIAPFTRVITMSIPTADESRVRGEYSIVDVGSCDESKNKL